MEELKLLVEIISQLPTTAIWILILFFAYKVIVVGSVFGVIRYIAGQLFNWLRERDHNVKAKDVRSMIEPICIYEAADRLLMQLNRIRNKGINSIYIHDQSVDWLRQAIDDREEKDREN